MRCVNPTVRTEPRSSPLLDIAFLCGKATIPDQNQIRPQPLFRSLGPSQTEMHEPNLKKTDDKFSDVGYQWQATLDIHLGHKILLDGNCITIDWPSDWEYTEQSIRDFRVAVRWVIKDPSRPGEMRDCSNCLSGAHLRKFIIERNRPPFASFGGTDEEPALRLDTFGQTQIKQWCKDILKVEKKPKESYLCFDLVRLTPQNTLVVEKRNIVTYKTNLKGYRFSKNGLFHSSSSITHKRPYSELNNSGSVHSSPKSEMLLTNEQQQINGKCHSTIAPRLEELTFYFEHLSECDVTHSDPLRWDDFVVFLKSIFPTNCISLLQKISHCIGKVWIYKNASFDHYVSWSSLRSAALWAGGSFVNFLRIIDTVLETNNPTWLFKIESSKREVLSKLRLQKNCTGAIRFCRHSPLTFHLITKNDRVPESYTTHRIEVSCDHRNTFVLRKVVSDSTSHFTSHLDEWITGCQLLSDPTTVNNDNNQNNNNNNSSGPDTDSSDSNNTSPLINHSQHRGLLDLQKDDLEPPPKKAHRIDLLSISSSSSS